MRNTNKLARIVGTVAIAGAAAAAALAVTPGTFGGFAWDTSNPGNSVKAGTLTMDNSADGSAVVTALSAPNKDNMQPGDTATGQVVIKNSGSLPADMSLEIVGSNTFPTAGDLTLTIKDGAATVYTGAVANVPATALGTGSWAAGESHTYDVSVALRSGAGNDAQAKTATFLLKWHGQQH